jgi:hypothetical protein
MQARRQEGADAQRLLVGPLRVIEEEQQRPIGGQVGDQPVQAVRRRERIAGVRGRVAGRLEQRLRQHGRALKQRRGLRLVRANHDRLEELAHAAIGEVLLELARQCRQDAEARRARLIGRQPQQRRLPDAALSLNHDNLAAAAVANHQGAFDRADLAVPVQEGVRRGAHLQPRQELSPHSPPALRSRVERDPLTKSTVAPQC